MNYGDLTASNVESSRTNLRRIARHEESEFSNASILNSMEQFVRTVNEMEETILVPSRLLDLAVGDSTDTVCSKGKRGSKIADTLANTDLYRLYNIINKMKVELLWSQDSSEDKQSNGDLKEDINSSINKSQSHLMENHQTNGSSSINSNSSSSSSNSNSISSSSSSISSSSSTGSCGRLGHARCPSTTSMQSVQSASSIVSSDSDSDTGIENDSGMESEEPSDRLAHVAAENFRKHLRGLHRSIHRMTEAAEYLTQRYQNDVCGQV